jgi:hypothetical protein
MRIVLIGVLFASVVAGACDGIRGGDGDDDDNSAQYCYLVTRAGLTVKVDSVLPDTTNACVTEIDIRSNADSVLPDTMFTAFRTAPRAAIGR